MAIAVEPRLLADTLSRALGTRDLDIEVFPDVSVASGAFDLAIVMADEAPGIEAAVVVRLPAETAGEAGSVTTADGTEPVALGDLAGIFEILDRFGIAG